MDLQAEYNAKRVATAMNLQRYYNECVEVMAKEQAGEIPMEDAKLAMGKLDVKWATIITDDISPKKNILELPKE
jgi:hypothetical protein